MQKALVAYFSVSGRTEMVAHTIAAELAPYEVSMGPIAYTGDHFLKDQGRLMQGDDSMLDFSSAFVDLTPFDLVCIGMPVHGGRPSFALDAYLKRLTGLDGKKVVIFATCRFLLYKTPEIMRAAVEQGGGDVVGEIWLKKLFAINAAHVKREMARLEHFSQLT